MQEWHVVQEIDNVSNLTERAKDMRISDDQIIQPEVILTAEDLDRALVESAKISRIEKLKKRTMLKENFNLVDKNAYQPGGIYINVCRRKKIYKDKTSSYGI